MFRMLADVREFWSHQMSLV